MIVAARAGLWSGDLQPLAEYLRSGFEIHGMVRREIAKAIDGGPEQLFHLKLAKEGKPGPGNPIATMRGIFRDLQIYAYVAEKSAAEPQMESVIAAAQSDFGLKRSSVMAAIKRAKEKWGESLPSMVRDFQQFN